MYQNFDSFYSTKTSTPALTKDSYLVVAEKAIITATSIQISFCHIITRLSRLHRMQKKETDKKLICR